MEGLNLGLSVLRSLASAQGVSDSELASVLRVDSNRLAPILATLVDRGFVYMDVLSLYWLGPQLLYLGGQASARNALIYASSEVMDNLLKDTREGVGLLVRNKLEAVMVAHRDFHDGRKLSRLPHLVPPRGPLHAGGASKVLLAYAPQEIIDEVIARYADSFLPASVRTREGILALLEGIRRDGFYVALGELHPDVFTINGPVRDPYGNVVASLGVMGLMTRLNPEYRQHLVESVLEGAQAISKLLG